MQLVKITKQFKEYLFTYYCVQGSVQSARDISGTQRLLGRKIIRNLCFFFFHIHTVLNFSNAYLIFKM